uniref:GRF-type domain-containing protein n=1 Tax=Noccaea caerulescens TaxID=107243 RepID=A0A1J3G984_NOCCA
MGRYSYSQPSSSSVRLCSGDEPDVSSTTRDYGIPNLCYCGLRTMMKTMDNTDAYPGRMFFGCKDYKDVDNMHLLKWWDEAMMEEFILLRRATDNQGDCIRVLRVADRIEAELAQLKQLALMEKKRDSRVELSIIIGLLLAGLIVWGCMTIFWFRV